MAEIEFSPQIFGNYYLLEHIAFGGMAEIYRAKSFGASGFERELVLKRVLKKLTDNPDFLRMLVNEAKLTATLQHGNIAQVFELGLTDGVYYMTMEYVEGVSLKRLLRRLGKAGKLLPQDVAAYIAMKIAKGLHHAHEKTDSSGKPLGIVHCDISPENIVIAFDGGVKIVDFGIARAHASFSNYKEGMVMGKFNYVAPEQAMGRPLDRRADIFSTGIILYEMLTGVHPFGRKGDVDTLVRIARFAKGEVESPSLKNPELRAELSDVNMMALANSLQERYQSSELFAEALNRQLGEVSTAQLHEGLLAALREHFPEEIEQRRTARAQDDAIISELQRKVAVQALSGQSPTPIARALSGAERGEAVSALSKGKGFWGAAALVLAVGLSAGFIGAKALSPSTAPYLFVSTQPEGAAVLLEGEEIGTAPLAHRLEGGRPYLLKLNLAGYEEYQETFTAEGELITKRPVLRPKLARLELLSKPAGAEVFINGETRGETPWREDLPVSAIYRVRVALGGSVEEREVHLEGVGSRLEFSFGSGPGGAVKGGGRDLLKAATSAPHRRSRPGR